MNPYEKCIANKIIKKKQCTVIWYADDNKTYHKDPEVVSKEIEILRKYFGNLVVYRGNTHIFLGINITILEDIKLEIYMKRQLTQII